MFLERDHVVVGLDQVLLLIQRVVLTAVMRDGRRHVSLLARAVGPHVLRLRVFLREATVFREHPFAALRHVKLLHRLLTLLKSMVALHRFTGARAHPMRASRCLLSSEWLFNDLFATVTFLQFFSLGHLR